MKLVTYHNIKSKKKEFPYFNFIDKKRYLKQLDYFEKNFGIIENENEIFTKNNKVLLTFDDGLKDHFFAANELRKRKKIGIFFPITNHFTEKNLILNVHKTHLILGKIKADIALKELLNFLKTFNNKENKYLIKSKYKDIYNKLHDNKYKNEFKKIINYSNNLKHKTTALNFLIKKFKINVRSKDFYLSKNEIRQISDMGMIIGCHTHSHNLMSSLSYANQSMEIKKSKQILSQITKKNMKYFCYPYGSEVSFNKSTVKLLKKNNFHYSFTDVHKSISLKNLISNPYKIPRYDCNQF